MLLVFVLVFDFYDGQPALYGLYSVALLGNRGKRDQIQKNVIHPNSYWLIPLWDVSACPFL